MSISEKFFDLKSKGWFRKIGIAAFLFFLIKGLIWIGILIWGYFAFLK